MEADIVHLALHVAQAITVVAILYHFIRTYLEVKSRFNLGLVFFTIAMLLTIMFGISLDIVIHLLAEALLLLALAIFLFAMRK